MSPRSRSRARPAPRSRPALRKACAWEIGSKVLPLSSCRCSGSASIFARSRPPDNGSVMRSGGPAAGRALVGAPEQRERGQREDLQVEPRGAVLDVPEVELDALLPREGGTAVHLRPAGQARLHVEAVALALVVAVDLVAERRSRADEAHLAAEDVPELRQLVDREAAEYPSGACDPRIALRDRVAGALGLRADDHRSQLQQLEVAAVLAHAHLPVE